MSHPFNGEYHEDKRLEGGVMEKQKHTPGPWTIEEDTSSKAYWIKGPNGDVCDLYARMMGRCERYENAEANAALIASAPELLEACKLALEVCTAYVNWRGEKPELKQHSIGRVHQDLCQAIAKAERGE